MRLITTVALSALLFLSFAPLAASTPYCNGNGQVFVVGGPGNTVGYFAVDFDVQGMWIWTWQEDNGVAMLQRGGYAMLTGVRDPCQDSATPDTAVFGWLVRM